MIIATIGIILLIFFLFALLLLIVGNISCSHQHSSSQFGTDLLDRHDIAALDYVFVANFLPIAPKFSSTDYTPIISTSCYNHPYVYTDAKNLDLISLELSHSMATPAIAAPTSETSGSIYLIEPFGNDIKAPTNADRVEDNHISSSENTETDISADAEATSYHHLGSAQLIIIVVNFLLFTIILVIPTCLEVLTIAIFIYDTIHWFYLWMQSSVTNTDYYLTNRHEKLVFLDLLEQYSQLCTLFTDDLLYYSSTHDCFHELTSNHHINYTLFLPFDTFEIHSYELSRISNIKLGIFYEDDNQLSPPICKTKYDIRFIFPKARLLEHLRHTIIIKSLNEGHKYRLQGLEDQADECFLTAREQCFLLAAELQQQLSVQSGSNPVEIFLRDNNNTNHLIL